MGLNHYACCGETIGDAHASRCGGSARYPLNREREAADHHARRISQMLDEQRESGCDG